MKGKLKILGLVMVAVLAMSAVVATAAQAQFTSNSAPTVAASTSALGNDVISVDGTSVECAVSSHLHETVSVLWGLWKKTKTMSSCKAFGFASATVNTNGCSFDVYSTGTVDIACAAGKAIVITASTCEVQIPAQTGLSKVTLTNHHPHVDMDFALSGITANRTKDGFLCPLTGTGHVSNATYNQAAAEHVEPVSGGTTISVD